MGFSPRFLRFKRLSFFTGSPRLAIRLIDEGEQTAPLWPLNSAESKKLLKRRFDFAGCSVEIPGRIFWQTDLATSEWYRDFYCFRWLKDIAASQNHKIASSLGREFVYEFTHNLHSAPAIACETDVMSERVAAWLNHRYFLLKGGSLRFRKRFLKRLITEISLLHAAFRRGNADSPYALHGLLSAACVFYELHYLLPPLLCALEEALTKTLLPDGMHLSRNASEHLRLLITLMEIRYTLSRLDIPSIPLQDAIQRMTSMLSVLTLGDGRLALFNGNLMEDATLLARIAQNNPMAVQAFAFISKSGFFRLERRGTILLFAGYPPVSYPWDAEYFNSFEFSDRNERIVVNCGYYHGPRAEWRQAMRQPSAHSSLSLEEMPLTDPAEAPAPTMFSIPENHEWKPSENRLQELESGVYATAEQRLSAHEVYFIHQRRLGMRQDGGEISGRDVLTLQNPEARIPPVMAKLRFHLHPDIRCQHPSPGEILLTSVKGSSWRFTLDHSAPVHMEESVYLGYYGKPQKTQQLVIGIPVQLPEVSIGWKFVKQAR